MREKLKPTWLAHMGNNHKEIQDPGYRADGYVSFTKHLNKPLTDELWKDLVTRIGITVLRIYTPGEGQWCDLMLPGGCIIELDKDGLVEDILLSPYWRPWRDA